LRVLLERCDKRPGHGTCCLSGDVGVGSADRSLSASPPLCLKQNPN
jgi:hypothetical protein